MGKILSSFSAKYQTRNVTLDFESNELGPQRLVDRKPLIALEPDIKDDKTIITVIVGDPEEESLQLLPMRSAKQLRCG